MSKVVREYYEKAGVKAFLIEEKMDKLSWNSDVLEEFEYWIKNHEYADKVRVDGYTASDLSKLSPYLNGEGVFMLLMELREKPEKAKERINKGLKIK